MKTKTLTDYQAEMQQCVKCGHCQAHCPTYLISQREGAVARGKIALATAVAAGEVTLEDRLREDIDFCLMCGSCVQSCPNRVPTPEIVGALRREISAEKGLSALGRGVALLTGSPLAMKAAVKGGALLRPLWARRVPDSSGLHLRLPPAGMAGRTLPELPFRNLFDRLPEFSPGQPGMPTVGFFAGCGISYLYPQVGEAMVAVLRGLGYGVYLPRAQRCCGIPALSSGNGQLVEELAAVNVAAFAARSVTAIVTACASCFGGISAHYQEMMAPAEFTGKVVEFSIFLQREGVVGRLAAMEKWPQRQLVTYHDPCHLKSHGITSEPRQLLRALPNIEFVEMDGAAPCCGLGGSFSARHYPESKKIGAAKIDGLQASGASLVTTACPGCMLQLQDIINHAGLDMRVVHILELLAEALTKEERC